MKTIVFHLTTGHEGPGREYRYNSTLSLTSALDGSGLSTPCLGRFTREKDSVPGVWEIGWASRLAWRVRNISPPLGFDSRNVQPVASCHND
jgi:hypothetical protein